MDVELILPYLQRAPQSIEALGHFKDPIGFLYSYMGDIGERRRSMRLRRRHDERRKRIGDIRQIDFLQGDERFAAPDRKSSLKRMHSDVGSHSFENIDYPFIPLTVGKVQTGDREVGRGQYGSDQWKCCRRPITADGHFTPPVRLCIGNFKIFIVAWILHLDAEPLHPIERQLNVWLFQPVVDGDGNGNLRKRAHQKQAGDELTVEALQSNGSAKKRTCDRDRRRDLVGIMHRNLDAQILKGIEQRLEGPPLDLLVAGKRDRSSGQRRDR